MSKYFSYLKSLRQILIEYMTAPIPDHDRDVEDLADQKGVVRPMVRDCEERLHQGHRERSGAIRACVYHEQRDTRPRQDS